MQALLSDIHNDFFEEMMKHAFKESTASLLNYQLTKNTLYGMIEYVEKKQENNTDFISSRKSRDSGERHGKLFYQPSLFKYIK